MKKIILSALAVAMCAAMSDARVKLPSVISNGMVLQCNTDASIWGWAAPGEKITVTPSWNPAAAATATAGPDGAWRCSIATPDATFTPQYFTVKGNENAVEVSDVLIGEVWMCTGQSNMVFPMGNHTQLSKWRIGVENAEEQLKDANYPGMRLFTVPYIVSADSALTDCRSRWLDATPETAYDFSAIGFLFGRRLAKELNVPVGLIFSAKGDSHAESWMPDEVMASDTLFNTAYAKYGKHMVKKSKKPYKIPSALWNGMIEPIKGYTVKGNIWYQGESNAERADRYPAVFTKMIETWRKEFNQPDMPFYFVQIAPYFKQPATIREAQLKVYQSGLPNIGMATTSDVGDSTDIHPSRKAPVADRLARWALNRQYGKHIACEPPVYKSMTVKGNKAIVSFDGAPDGLFTPGGEAPTGFFIAGEDRRFYPATAVIDGSKVIVTAPEVKKPKAVRMGYSNFFRTNLRGTDGLPASPFRTDNW